MADATVTESRAVTRFAIFAGPDSLTNLSGWVFTDLAAAERARPEYGRGAMIAVLPDADMAVRLAAVPGPVCDVVGPGLTRFR